MNEALTNDLLSRAKVDQEMRARVTQDGFDKWDSKVDEENTAYLEAVVNKSGWPKISEIGSEAAKAAWLLVQHADHKPDFQAHCLKLMKDLPRDKVSLRDIAYLEDRVRVNRGEPQLYGTQFLQTGDTFEALPIEDRGNLEARRANMGLETFAENMQRMLDTYTKQD